MKRFGSIPKIERAGAGKKATGGEVSHTGRVKASTGKQHTLKTEKAQAHVR